ncbi:MAG: hypothetical protein JO327_07470 [Nitrososphaeraceae archaeon]|nr:hypothetical protein [Nitrososphaeraceae archaeon]MBV9667955.1 hypothetical protein [Nitrososphaeraceae archaeon]
MTIQVRKILFGGGLWKSDDGGQTWDSFGKNSIYHWMLIQTCSQEIKDEL